MVPCAAHWFDLRFSDLCKYGALADAVAFGNHMTQYWRNHNLLKMVLERCQRAEYDGKVIQLQRPATTRWKSQLVAASSLADTRNAMENAVVDVAFKSQCLRGGTTEQRGSAEEAAKAVRDEGKWGALTLMVKLLRPLATALDSGQENGRGLGSVRRSFYEVEAHFCNFDYDVPGRRGDGGDRLRFKQHTLRCLQERKRYTLRPIHSLVYLLDPRYTDAAEKPEAAEATEAFALLRSGRRRKTSTWRWRFTVSTTRAACPPRIPVPHKSTSCMSTRSSSPRRGCGLSWTLCGRCPPCVTRCAGG